MRLLLIRHGQTPSNVAGALDTAFPGAGLTPLGQAQSRAVPGALASEGIAGVYASELVRTQHTADPLARSLGLEVRVRAGLEEVEAGELEMRTDEDAVLAYVGCLDQWLHGGLEHRMPGGATGHEFYARYEQALHGVAADHGHDETVAVFSHGAAIRAYVALAAGLAPERSSRLWIMNTGMAVLEGTPDSGWTLADWVSEPLGGTRLEDVSAHDITGESTDEAMHEH